MMIEASKSMKDFPKVHMEGQSDETEDRVLSNGQLQRPFWPQIVHQNVR